MRLLLLTTILLLAAGCDKVIHEARTPIRWNQAAAQISHP